MSVLVMDIGGSGIKYAIIDKELNLIRASERKNDFTNKEEFLNAIREIAEELNGLFEGISISYCGKMDPDTGELSNPGYYRYMHGSNLKQLIEEHTGFPVELENDGNCAALAELQYGSLQDCRSACALTIGTGLGLALIQNRKIWHGAHFNAGLASFMIPGYQMEAERDNMIFRYTGHEYLTSSYANKKKISTAGLNGKVFFSKYHEGDSDAAEILREYCRNIAYVIYNLQVILDVEAYAIGGGISAQQALIDGIKKELDAIYDKIGIPMKRPAIKACKFFNESNLIGAYYHYVLKQNDRNEM